MVGLGFDFASPLREAPAFTSDSSFGIIVRITELPSINPQPPAAVVNIQSGVFTMQGPFLSHPQIAGHLMKIRQLGSPIKDHLN